MGGQSTEITHPKFKRIGTVSDGLREYPLWLNELTFETKCNLPEGYELCNNCNGRRFILVRERHYTECSKCKSKGVVNWIDQILR